MRLEAACAGEPRFLTKMFLVPFMLIPDRSFQKLIPEVMGKEIEKAVQGIYPLQNVYIRKVKILKSPKVDLGKLLESHGETGVDDTGAKVGSGEFKEPTPLAQV